MQWVNNCARLAVGLTKSPALWQIARFLNSGQIYRLVHDPSRHNAKWRRQRDAGALEDVFASTA